MLKARSATPYWNEYAQYQTFKSVEQLFAFVKRFVKKFQLTKAMQAILNTIKLHSKTFAGVCWLKRDQIAQKAGVSVSSVDRAIGEFVEVGIITVLPQTHTKRGGDTHNVYVINPVDNLVDDEASDEAFEEPNEDASATQKSGSIPCGSKDESPVDNSHKNLNNNSNKNLDRKISNDIYDEDDSDITLRNVPEEFRKIMRPYYSDAEVILQRWKTVCVASKKSCHHLGNTTWETIKEAWKVTVNHYKRNKIRNVAEKGEVDALGGYYYSILCEMMVQDYLDKIWGTGDDQVEA